MTCPILLSCEVAEKCLLLCVLQHASLSLLHFHTYSHTKHNKTQQKRAISSMLTFSIKHTHAGREDADHSVCCEAGVVSKTSPARHHSFTPFSSEATSLSLPPPPLTQLPHTRPRLFSPSSTKQRLISL